MGKIKIHEIAKEMGLTSKEIIERAKKLGIEVTSHLSSVDDDQSKKIKDSFGKDTSNGEKKKETKKEANSNKKEATPVIIRREVIIAEEEEKAAVSHQKRVEENKKDVGFVERNGNKDFNIVYRNKQTKPLTVNELFGIKSKDEKKAMPKEEVVEAKPEIKVEKVIPEEKKEVITETQQSNIKAEDNFEPKIKEEHKESQNSNMDNHNNYNRNNNSQSGDNRGYNRNNNNQYGDNRNYNRNNNSQNGDNRGYNRNNNGQNRDNGGYNRNNNNQSGDNRGYNRNNNGQNNNGYNRNNNQSGDNRGYNRNNNSQNNNGYRNNGGYNNRNNYASGDNRGQFNRNDRRPLDEKGIDKNIKNIMTTEIVEKELQRDYSSKVMEKQKVNSKYDDKANKKTKKKTVGRFEEIDGGKLKDLKQVDKLSNMFNEQDGGMLEYYDLTTARGKKNRRRPQRNDEERVKQKIFELKEITIPESITVKDLAAEMKKTTAEIIKKLFNFGIMATINNPIDFDTAYLIAGEFGITANKKEEVKEEDILFDETEDKTEELEARPPVVVVMGHVDHGKTSLLDAIRSTNVIEGEAGGITQHIGAYKVNVNGREITFLDTPGHEAFTSMRARGAQITDIAILVVAADDGVMPQTIEAINHAKAAEIPIIVAVNKIDLPGANIEKIKQSLMEYELVPEEWGGDTIFVPISAKQRINIENLLEMVLLVADMKELKANPHKQAKGTVIEARLDKAKGPIASMLVQRGTLDVGDTVVVGTSIGRIRAMKNDKGQKIKKAGPSTPVEIMGLTNVPEAGEVFYEVKDEKMAKHLIERRKRQEREKAIAEDNKVTLNNLFEKMESENLKQLDIIVKADVQGTSEAVKQSLEKISNEEVRVKVIHSAVGAVSESDVQLAKAAKAIIIAFNVRPSIAAKDMAEKDGVEIKQYSVIYQAIEDVEAAMKGMLDPVYVEKVIGNAEVRQTFKVSSVGTIAGCYVLDGKIERNAGVRIVRENVVIHEGKLASLKRFKDDVKEVTKGYECGIQIEKYNDLKEGDIIEFFIMEEVKK